MKQILEVNNSVLQIIGKAKHSDCGYRLSHYTVVEEIEDGFLVFNTLTREMVLLDQDEYANIMKDPYMHTHWFVVPQNLREKDMALAVRWLQNTKKKKKKRIKQYNIYSTTDCNARCFYCFEHGRKRVPMSDEVAYKTAEFIKANCDGRPVSLRWFGGEPLYNTRPLDIICEALKEAGITYNSITTSNGYLFNEENVRKCVELWNMRCVVISMDGTEEVFNKSKRFIYKEGNPYQIVMENIRRMLENNIMVSIHLNMDFYNLDDLNVFVEELAQRFASYDHFTVTTHLIINEKKEWDSYRTLEQWIELYKAKEQLSQKLEELGIALRQNYRLPSKVSTNSCMVDDEQSIVITPDGHTGVCEHYSETHYTGHLDSPERDQAVIDKFRERAADIPECDTCFRYPQCVRLVKNCPYFIPCIEPERQHWRKRIGKSMVAEYQRWLNNEQIVDSDEDEQFLEEH